jgi:hypothetical protein
MGGEPQLGDLLAEGRTGRHEGSCFKRAGSNCSPLKNVRWVDRVGQTHILEAILILQPFRVS